MFTGLIEEVGALVGVEPRLGGRVLRIAAHKVTDDLKLGDSIALNGVCQTVTAFGPDWFTVDAVGDTLEKTTLGTLTIGTSLNLERACRADTRLGGHFVLGHVNGMGKVVTWVSRGESWTLEIAPPQELRRYLVAEGSVAVDGISLTVAETQPDRFRLSIIPHTRAATTLADLKPGQWVNLEADILAKYIEGLIAAPAGDLDDGQLRRWGYL